MPSSCQGAIGSCLINCKAYKLTETDCVDCNQMQSIDETFSHNMCRQGQIKLMCLPLHRHVGNACVHPQPVMLGFISFSTTYRALDCRVGGFHFNACATVANAPTTVAIAISTFSQKTFPESRSFDSELRV